LGALYLYKIENLAFKQQIKNIFLDFKIVEHVEYYNVLALAILEGLQLLYLPPKFGTIYVQILIYNSRIARLDFFRFYTLCLI